MAGIVESILLNISAVVTGGAGVAGLAGGIGGLTSKLLGLNAGLQIVQQVTGAISGMVATMGDYAAKADGAAVSARSWQVVLERFNVDAKSAGEAISELSQRTGASEMSLKSAAAQYIKMGGTLEDFSKVALAASSSWYDLTVKSISLDDAINNVSTGVASGRSELLESSGVMLNASQAYKRYSDEIGKSVDEMSDAEKAHAYAIGVFKEEQIGIETLTEKQTELSRAKNAETQASDRLAEAIGRNLIPLQVKLTQTSAEVQRALTQMFDAYQQGGDALKTLTDKYPQLGRALTTLKPIMDALGRAGREVFAALVDSARNLMPVVESLRPLFERVWGAIPGIIEKAGRVISETFHAINDLWTNVLKPVWDSLQPALGAAVDGIIKNLNDMLDYMDGMVTTVRALINGDWKGAWATFSEAVSKAYASVRENLQKIDEVYQEWEKNAIASVFESAKNIGLNIKDGIIAGITDLSLELSQKVEAAITAMTDRLPQWVKDRMGLDGLKDALDNAQSGAVDRAQAARARIAGRAPEIDPKTLNDFQKFILSASETGRGLDGKFNDKADNLIDWCARWMRDTLGDAAPEMRMAVNALFLNNPEKGGPTARSAYGNFQKAGLARDYKTFADLKPGDTVFYTDGGQNHTGVYIGNGQVRGNNRVTYQDNGGRFGPGGINSGKALDNGRVNPVGDVDIDRLGKVTGYVRSDELKAYLDGRVPVTGQPKAGNTANTKTTTTTPPPADAVESDVYTAKQYAQAMNLIKAIEAAKKASQAKPGDFGLAKILTAAEQASEKFTKATKAQEAAMKAANAAGGGSKGKDGYVTTAENIATYGEKALQLIKAVEVAEKSTDATTRTLAQNRLDAFVKLGDAQAGVVQAERAAYESRKQLSEKEKQDSQARADQVAEIARNAAAGRETDARAGVESLKRQQQLKLDLAEGNAAKIAQITVSTGPQILAAEALVNREVRKQAVAAAQVLADKRLEVAGANAIQIEADRKATAVRAYQAERSANAASLAEQQRAERDASKTATEAQKAREKEQRDLRAKYAAERRDLNVQEAQATLSRTQELNRQELDAFKGAAGERALIVKRQAKDEYDAAEQVARAARDKAVRDFQNAGGPNTGRNVAGATQAYADAVKRAEGARDKLLSDADTAITDASVRWAATLTTNVGAGLEAGIRSKRADEALSQKAAEWSGILGNSLFDKAIATLTEQQRVTLGIQATGNEAIAAAAQKTAGELAQGEQWNEALDVLGGALDRVMTSALEGEDAGDSINTLTQAINELTDARARAISVARQEQAARFSTPIDANPERRPGSMVDALGQPMTGTSDPRRTRAGERLNADGTPYVDPGVAPRDAGGADRDRAWDTVRRSEAVDAYKDSLKLLDLQQLDTAKSAAILAKDTERYGYILSEIESKKADRADLDEIQRQAAALAALDEQLAPIAVNLQSVFGRLESGSQTAGEARVELAALRTQLEGIGGPAAQSLIGVIDQTVTSFDSLGSVSAEVTAALGKLRKEAELPYDRLIRKLQQMRTEPGAATAEIDALILSLQKLNGAAAKAQGIEKMTAKINEFADYAKKSIPLVTSAFQALGGASDEVAGAWGDSLGRMVDDLANFATAIAKGDYISAAIQGLTSIFTFFARKAQEARAEMKKTEDYNKGFKFDADGYGTRKTQSTTTGFLFWQKTVVTEQIDEAGKQMALTFENAVTGGVGSGLAAAVASNDSSILEQSIFTKMKDAALGGLTEAFFTSGTVVAVVGPLIQKLIAAFKSGNTENIRSAVAEFRDGVKGLRSEMDGLVEAGKIVTDERGGAGESFASSFSDSIRSGVRALLSGQSPLQALYDDVRGKIENAVVNGFFVQAALDKLQPFLDALKAKLDAGLDPTQAIAQIGGQLPGISAQLQLELGPLVAALNTYLPNALNANTSALNGNTAALKESQFQTTYAVSYADVGRPSNVRQQLAGL